ncbi:MAG TPA: hypothetical protein VH854_09630 [Thermoanaerobaculia bacterium]|jgi:hypothetical protein|nr:hypothetical protein [Thermoanaerobaculia bacterium]
MRIERVATSAVLSAFLALSFACEKQPPSSAAESTPEAKRDEPPAPPAERHVLDPMPTPVRGHFSEINTGEFDLVDGVAYTAPTGETVVYVTSKTIGSSSFAASSPCPMTQARFMTALRGAGWNEVALDRDGHSAYFAEGMAFDGSGRETDVGGRYWKSWIEVSNGTAMGRVRHREHGEFEFALPLAKPAIPQVAMSDATGARRAVAGAPTPKEAAVAAAYRVSRTAAMKKDLDGLLRQQGFDAKQIAAIRALDHIQSDLGRLADRFLKPGAAGEFQSGPGWAGIRGEGTNSKGAKFVNYYWFTSCGERLVLTQISENPM